MAPTNRAVSRSNEELLRDWFAHLRARHLGSNTIYTYESTALALLRFSGATSFTKLPPRRLDGSKCS